MSLAFSVPAQADEPPQNVPCTEAFLGVVIITPPNEEWECVEDEALNFYYWEPAPGPQDPDFNAASTFGEIYNDGLLGIPLQSIVEQPGEQLNSLTNVWSLIEGQLYTLPAGFIGAENLFYGSPDGGSTWSLLGNSGLQYSTASSDGVDLQSDWYDYPAAGWTFATWSYGAVYEGQYAGWKGGWEYSGPMVVGSNGELVAAAHADGMTQPQHPTKIALAPPPSTPQARAVEKRLDQAKQNPSDTMPPSPPSSMVIRRTGVTGVSG